MYKTVAKGMFLLWLSIEILGAIIVIPIERAL